MWAPPLRPFHELNLLMPGQVTITFKEQVIYNQVKLHIPCCPYKLSKHHGRWESDLPGSWCTWNVHTVIKKWTLFQLQLATKVNHFINNSIPIVLLRIFHRRWILVRGTSDRLAFSSEGAPRCQTSTGVISKMKLELLSTQQNSTITSEKPIGFLILLRGMRSCPWLSHARC